MFNPGRKPTNGKQKDFAGNAKDEIRKITKKYLQKVDEDLEEMPAKSRWILLTQLMKYVLSEEKQKTETEYSGGIKISVDYGDKSIEISDDELEKLENNIAIENGDEDDE